MTKQMQTQAQAEQTKVIGVHIKLAKNCAQNMAEFEALIKAAGADLKQTLICRKDYPHPQTYIGAGKIQELSELIQAQAINLVIFNVILSPTQERNLEQALQCRVLDRKGLILDIFAQRAQSFEGKLQVELAQLQHQLPRLIRGRVYLQHQKGGIGLRGPGETQLELDRRLIRGRIKQLERRIAKVQSQRQLTRSRRQKQGLATIALVGYTNAGKSSLFRLLTKDANTLVADKLFATLDPTARAIYLPDYGKAIFIDTVGFVQDLPTELVAAFAATLEETRQADLLLHIIDCSDEFWLQKKRTVEKLLFELNALHIPVLEVYNKIDLVPGSVSGCKLAYDQVAQVQISVKQTIGITELLASIASRLQTAVTNKLVNSQE